MALRHPPWSYTAYKSCDFDVPHAFVSTPLNSVNVIVIVLGANLCEEFEITALFHIPKKYPCSYAFAQMEQAKKELLIDDYSITQTSLEQVNLNDFSSKHNLILYNPSGIYFMFVLNE